MLTLALLLTTQPALADKYVFFGTGTIGPLDYTGGSYTPVDQYWLHRFSDTVLDSCSTTSYANDWSTEYNEDNNSVIFSDRVWPHALFYADDFDMLYAALIYSNAMTFSTLYSVPVPGSGSSVGGAIGSVAIYDDPVGMTSGGPPDRELFGVTTQLDMPHAIAVDDLDGLLYVANTQNGSDCGEILVWENADTVDGNTAPDYTLSLGLCHPVDVHYDEITDTLTVVDWAPSTQPEVWLYENVSADLLGSGSSEPDIRWTFADVTSSDFIHETWFWGGDDQLFFTTRGRYLHRFDTSIYHGYPTSTCNGIDDSGCPSDPLGSNDCVYIAGILYAYLDCADFETDAQVDLTNGYGGLGGFGLQVEEANNVLWTVVTDDDNTGDERLLRYTSANTLSSSASPNKTICWDESDNSGNFFYSQGLWVVTD